MRHIHTARLAILAITVLTIVGSASPAGAEDAERYTITVGGTPAERPILGQLEQEAAAEGITLEAAIDRYVADVADPGWGHNEPGGPPSQPDMEIDGIHLWELEDMEVIAARDGVQLAEVIDSHGWQTDFLQLADTIEATYPAQFSGAGITFDNPRTAWFGFKDTIPADVVSLVGSLPTQTELVGNKGFSEAELVHLLNQTHDVIYGHSEIADVHGGYDIDTGVIEIDARPVIPVVDEVQRAELEARLQPAPPANGSITIEVSAVNHLDAGVDDSYVRGGGLLNGSGTCTAGFGVEEIGSGRWGVVTARHCAENNATYLYKNHQVHGGSTTVSRKVRGNVNYGDVAWYDDGSYVTTRMFYYNTGKSRYATSVWSPRTGVEACKFGRTSGATCDKTYKINQTRSNYKGLAATHRRKSDGGDSGGPWYWGGAAYGVHSGYKTINLIRRDMFTPAKNLPDAMHVKVRIN